MVAIGDEDFAAVDDPIVAVLFGGGADSLQVAAGRRLRHCQGTDLLAGSHVGEELLDLLRSTVSG